MPDDLVAFVQQNGATVLVVGLMVLMHVFGFGHGGHGRAGHDGRHGEHSAEDEPAGGQGTRPRAPRA